MALMRLTTLIQEFDEYMEFEQISTTTQHQYRDRLIGFLATLPNIEEDIKNPDYYTKHFVKKIEISNNALKFTQAALRTFLQSQKLNPGTKQHILEKFIKAPDVQIPQRVRKYLEPEEILEVINNLKHEKHKVIALIQAQTGLRTGDIINMRVNKEGQEPFITEKYKDKDVLKIMTIGKRRKAATGFLHDPITIEIVHKYLLNAKLYRGYYFMRDLKASNVRGLLTDYKMRRQTYRHYMNDLTQALQEARIDPYLFRTHDFRRCFARRVWDKYKDLQKLMQVLHHKKPTTTMLYLSRSGLDIIDTQYEVQQDLALNKETSNE